MKTAAVACTRCELTERKSEFIRRLLECEFRWVVDGSQ